MSCFVKSCTNYRQKCKKEGRLVEFHRFPTDSTLRREWIRLCDRDLEEIKQSSRICSEHFELNDYTEGSRSILQPTSIPSINLPELTGCRRVAFNEAAFGSQMLNTLHELRTEVEKWKSAYIKLISDTKMRQLNLKMKLREAKRVNQTESSKHRRIKQEWKREVQKLKQDIRNLKAEMRKEDIAKREMSSQLKTTKKNSSELQALKSKFTKSQVDVIVKNKTKTVWNDENISKALCLRAKSPSAYNFVRNQWKLPLPSMSTLKRWTKSIVMKPGLIFPVLNLLKHEFSDKTDFERCCCLSFDEVSLDGTVCYDPALDKIVGPHSNIVGPHSFVRIRTFIRIKYLNARLDHMKWLKKRTRKVTMFTRSRVLKLSTPLAEPTIEEPSETQQLEKEDSEEDELEESASSDVDMTA